MNRITYQPIKQRIDKQSAPIGDKCTYVCAAVPSNILLLACLLLHSTFIYFHFFTERFRNFLEIGIQFKFKIQIQIAFISFDSNATANFHSVHSPVSRQHTRKREMRNGCYFRCTAGCNGTNGEARTWPPAVCLNLSLV